VTSYRDDASGSLPEDDQRRLAELIEDHLREFTQRAIGDLAFSLLYFIDEPNGTSWDTPPEHDIADGDRRWPPAETEPGRRPADRDAGDPHESLSDTDPSGHEGAGWIT
jgi:hypothetical protein